MEKCELVIEDTQDLDQVLGYLNFSAGNPEPNFLARLNRIWAVAESQQVEPPSWRRVAECLSKRLAELAANSTVFQDAGQATAVLQLLSDQVIPEYWRFHGDLLFHHSQAGLINSLFFGRICEAVLRQGPPWSDTERITKGAIAQLNDFVGYRPVPVLETRRVEPYPHERIRPIPLWIRGVGAAVGRYQEVVELALGLLERAAPELLRQAQYDASLLDELSFDPRAYDFDHPVNKRPNYHFGQWDPHLIDQQGRYRRYVIQQVTLDALMRRLEGGSELKSDSETESEPGTEKKIPREQLKVEAAAVLAGTILMGSGVSGAGPDAYDSETTLTKLLPRIAAYRDTFYEHLIGLTGEAHAERLIAEAQERRQPFGGARQHLNAQLARRRASQLEHVQLAGIFARLGYAEEAAQHAEFVPAASARILCQVDCRLTSASLAIDQGQREQAFQRMGEVMELVHRGIGCGAIVDPWNILGFDAQFSLFPAAENSVHDHRLDELIERLERVFGLLSRLWSEAAAVDEQSLCDRVSGEFRRIAKWWRQFAAHEVTNVTAIDALDAFHAAEHVARALGLWHKGGAATGDIGFWAKHAEMFDSPQAYALVIDALIHQGDFVASMGLLIHWLSQAERIPLAKGGSSFHELAQQWLRKLCTCPTRPAPFEPAETLPRSERRVAIGPKAWKQARKFFDYIEANAGDFGSVPRFQLTDTTSGQRRAVNQRTEPNSSEDEPDLYGAAYESVVFRDSADDGMEGPIFDSSVGTNDELTRESERLANRLAMFNTLAGLWNLVALAPLADPEENAATMEELRRDRTAAMQHWRDIAVRSRSALLELVDDVQGYSIRATSADHDSLVEYDRQRVVKESILERIIATTVEIAAAARTLAAAVEASIAPPACPAAQPTTVQSHGKTPPTEKTAKPAETALPRSDSKESESPPSEVPSPETKRMPSKTKGGRRGKSQKPEASRSESKSGEAPPSVTPTSASADASSPGDVSSASVPPAASATAKNPKQPQDPQEARAAEEALTMASIAAILRRDPVEASRCANLLMLMLVDRPLLYIPLAKSGNPREIVETRTRQRCIQVLLKCLPRLGLVAETCQLIETAREMERNHPVGPGAVTEFDELFKIGYRGLIESLVVSFESWKPEATREKEAELTGLLISQLEKITESMLESWLAHSRTLRLSVLEKVNEKRSWQKLVDFVERYGTDLFTQRFLNIGNIRAILHQGVTHWFQRLEDAGMQDELRLLTELDRKISRQEAADCLSMILDAIIENYSEYRDYNSTTTQSDRGELLYTLLDFLRLRARYDRVCWNLKPVVLAHEILVRRGQKQPAQVWRRALRERIGGEAEKFHQKLVDLQKKYAMQMPSIADRISERFLRPLSIDRLCALVKPAADEAPRAGNRPNFRMLKVEIESLTREPSGVGFDVPAWLGALEEEVQRAMNPDHHHNGFDEFEAAVPYLPLTREAAQRQVDAIAEKKP